MTTSSARPASLAEPAGRRAPGCRRPRRCTRRADHDALAIPLVGPTAHGCSKLNSLPADAPAAGAPVV